MRLPDDDKPEQPPGQRPCMDDYEYNTWEFWNERCSGPAKAKSPCEDCTLAFSAEMATLGLCDGTPTVVIKSKHEGTSSGEHLTRSEAQQLRYSVETEAQRERRRKAHKAAYTEERRTWMSHRMRARNLDPEWQAKRREAKEQKEHP